MSTTPSFEVVPISQIAFRGSAVSTGSMRQIERQGPVVLIVDDERIIADTLSMILSRSGFAVLTAYDGQSALELARIIPPELLLTDVMMAPGMNGVELATAVAETVPDCKILLFSGQAATVDLLADARDTGHNFTLLTKPLHPTELLARIAAALEVRESIAAP
jgi:DNA-binding response OmpR family regulator